MLQTYTILSFFTVFFLQGYYSELPHQPATRPDGYIHQCKLVDFNFSKGLCCTNTDMAVDCAFAAPAPIKPY
ncbi:hypothetical protein P8452_02641 [Trifolium repens]|nr:hypothetical protein P8452_02641 [Trifolium repens]